MGDEKPEDEESGGWDRAAEAWARHLRRGADIVRDAFTMPSFLAFVGSLEGKTVLDAGCGEGSSSRELARRGATVVGVDISPRMIELARQEEGRAPLGIRYVESRLSKLSDFAEASFDAVLSFMALMDAPELAANFGEFHRVLVPGGMLAFGVLHPCFHTRGIGWVTDPAGRRVGLTVADYFSGSPPGWSGGRFHPAMGRALRSSPSAASPTGCPIT